MSNNVTIVFGTRPEAIKMCPLIKELKGRKNFIIRVCVSGQHREMLDDVLHFFDVVPDVDLSVMKAGQTLSELTYRILEGMRKEFCENSPSLVLVHGDTTTAFAASLAAFYQKIPIAHVEAGLRSGNIYEPYPEEFNRRAITLMADYHFAPTELAKKNLIAEGVRRERIFVTGNTVVDALRYTERKDFYHPIIDRIGRRKFVLLTAHRRENVGEPMREVFRAVRRVISEDTRLCVVYPIHKNPNVRRIAIEELGGIDRIYLTEAMDTVTFHNFLRRSYLVLTDSGGVQEEAVSIGKPTLVFRNETERKEGIDSGAIRLVGNDAEDIYWWIKKLLRDPEEYKKMSSQKVLYGDGYASKRIADVLLSEII